MPRFDAIVVGTGQAGPSLARRLVAAGRKVAVIERKHFGGTCVNTGCTPTKALVASAYAAHLARRHADYGVTVGGPIAVDMKAVKARKDAIVAPSRNGVERSLKSLDGCTVYQGHGRFVSPTEVQVGETVLKARQIFINVGGRAAVPPKCLRSITATLRPAATRRRASDGPAWPVPITMASKLGMARVPSMAHSPPFALQERITSIQFAVTFG